MSDFADRTPAENAGSAWLSDTTDPNPTSEAVTTTAAPSLSKAVATPTQPNAAESPSALFNAQIAVNLAALTGGPRATSPATPTSPTVLAATTTTNNNDSPQEETFGMLPAGQSPTVSPPFASLDTPATDAVAGDAAPVPQVTDNNGIAAAESSAEENAQTHAVDTANPNSGASRRGSQQSRRSTTQGARATAHGHKNNFAKSSGVSYENYYFHNEDVTSFGVGTVGLYAAGGASTGRRGVDGGQDDGAHTSTRYPHATNFGNTFPPPLQQPGESAWDRKQADYRQWKHRRLAGSSYARLSQAAATARSTNATTNGDSGAAKSNATNARMSFSGTQNFLDLPDLWTREERMRIEQRRLRALEAERSTQAETRAQTQHLYNTQVLRHRTRKLRGEAVDLPDAYFRATYPDPSAPKGYADPPRSHNANHASTTGSSARDTLDEYDTARIVKDHLRAGQQHRVEMQQRQLVEEARRQEAAEKQRQTVSAELEQKRVQAEAFKEEWMAGRPRVSRSREAQRRHAQQAEKAAAAQWNHSARAQERELYARYAMEDAAVTSAHQKALRKRVLTRPHSRRGDSPAVAQTNGGHPAEGRSGSSGRLGGTAKPRAASPPAASPPNYSTHETAVKDEKVKETEVRPITPAPPSQLVGPTSTNFFNEVKMWTQEYTSPNTVPPNAADASHRKVWKAELEEAALRFNRENTQRQRESYPRKIQEARGKTQEANWTFAEQERQEKKVFAARRADQAQADLLAATSVRVEVQDEALRAQQQRQAQAAEKREEVQLQRLQSKHREEVLRSLEAEELQQLRLIVSAGGTRS